MRRDLDLPISLEDVLAAEPDMAALRETFRRYELRDPLRRLEEVLGRVPAAPRSDAQAPASLREVTLARARGAARGRGRARRARRRRCRRGRSSRRRAAGASASRSRARCSSATATAPAEVVAALGDAPGRRARREGARRGAGRPRLRHDARGVPARPGAARLPARGALRGPRHRPRPRGSGGVARGGGGGARGGAAPGARGARAGAAAAPTSSCRWSRVLRAMELAGIALDLERLAAITERVQAEVASLERRDLGGRRARSS